MNIFSTSHCPIKSAQEMCNVHVVKMLLEQFQLMSTAHYELDGVQVGYKPSHHNHPSSKWCRSTSANYQWLYDHAKALCDEYTYRTGKVHKSSALLPVLARHPANIKHGELEPFAMAMPEKYQRLGLFDQTKAYQVYLKDKLTEWTCREKPMRVEWTKRNPPEWFL